ncbi:FIST C-terminal domain-containing protein [Sphingobium sufflavum]|uniref:FIST signal transduction protein n=1 Tax=Sphingobium sufflavum TaxID=1129547 RepID=UPI001F2BDCA0|nr:FIST N-terminal domain-containing protein [Sphingobium sufflavum]MCE7798903.1 FIST C-terminal domain-containing protein [Sphingobium sufflavum]
MWVEKFYLCSESLDEIAQLSVERSPNLIFLFGDTDTIASGRAPAGLFERFPLAAHLGCSTGTLVKGVDLHDDGLLIVLVGFESTRIALHCEPLADIDRSFPAGAALARKIAAPDLAGLFLLSSGLGVNGSALVEGIQSILGRKAVISGGLAGDGARFETTWISINGKPVEKAIAAIGFYGTSVRLAHGIAGGWSEFGPTRRVTKSAGSTLLELDHKPALDLYKRYLGDEATGLPASGLLFPLMIWDEANPDDAVVRTILSVDHDARSITLAGDIPEGWCAKLMRGTQESLVEGARQAAQHARTAMGDTKVDSELCLFVSCVGRRLLMGQSTEEEVDAVSEALGVATKIAGFYSYGEIAPQNVSEVCGLHNQTVTLTLLSEAA